MIIMIFENLKWREKCCDPVFLEWLPMSLVTLENNLTSLRSTCSKIKCNNHQYLNFGAYCKYE